MIETFYTKPARQVVENVKGLHSQLEALTLVVKAKVQNRMNKESPIPDFMGNLIQSHKDGKMTTFQLNSNAVFLMAAGTETLVTAIVHTVFRLLTNKSTLAKLVREIRGSFATAEDIDISGVNKCKYLLACINENLRIQAPSPATHPRYTPAEGTTIDGHYIPGNVAVGVPIHAACRSSLNFRDPDKYIPERWTGELPEYDGDAKDAAMIFSVGPRDCKCLLFGWKRGMLSNQVMCRSGPQHCNDGTETCSCSLDLAIRYRAMFS